jgi:hypothetical protein
MTDLKDQIFRIISEKEPVTTKEIQDVLQEYGVNASKESINSALYGPLRNTVVRDVNVKGIPAWRIKRATFAAAGGLEAKFYAELIRQKIVTKDESHLGFTVKNTRNNKRYHLDIAVIRNGNRYDIEIDGFDHVRADALASLERQIIEGGKNMEPEIDWMDNEKSYVAYSEINTKVVYPWLATHIDWTVRYHEELLWPKDITRNIWLIERGWKVIRFWNTQIQKDIKKCAEEAREFLS